jgi:hypothetical protein
MNYVILNRYEALYLGELDQRDYGPLVDGLLERRAPMLLRIAMLFALTDVTQVVETKHIDAALAWVRYWAESVRFIFSSAAQEEVQGEIADMAGKIVEFVHAKGDATRKQITVECFRGHEPKDRIDAALDDLLSATPPRITVESVPRPKGSPGIATKIYRLPANRANKANCEDSCGQAADPTIGELCEPSALCGEAVRTVRAASSQAATRAGPHPSLGSHSSPWESGHDDDDVESF